MDNLTNIDNIIELHEELNEFAKHWTNKGGQAAHRLIKKELVDKRKGQPLETSKEGELINQGYDKAIKEVFSLLHKHFVP